MIEWSDLLDSHSPARSDVYGRAYYTVCTLTDYLLDLVVLPGTKASRIARRSHDVQIASGMWGLGEGPERNGKLGSMDVGNEVVKWLAVSLA